MRRNLEEMGGYEVRTVMSWPAARLFLVTLLCSRFSTPRPTGQARSSVQAPYGPLLVPRYGVANIESDPPACLPACRVCLAPVALTSALPEDIWTFGTTGFLLSKPTTTPHPPPQRRQSRHRSQTSDRLIHSFHSIAIGTLQLFPRPTP